MSMTPNAVAAFARMKARGISVPAWGRADCYGPDSQFVIVDESRHEIVS